MSSAPLRFVRRMLSAAVATTCVVGLVVVGSTAAQAAGQPTFVQQANTQKANRSSVTVTPTAALGAGNRLIVEVGVWNLTAATAAAVTDSAGDTFTLVQRVVAADRTELSVWTAPVTAGAGSKPVVTIKATATADIGATVLEYAGLSAAPGVGSVDASTATTGLTTGAATVASGPVTATAGNELAIGFYADSGFGDTLTAGSGFSPRANVAPTSYTEMLVEDTPVVAGATANASVRTGANTNWEMATVVFASDAVTAPGAPSNLLATPGDSSATVSWTAPASGNNPVTGYTVTPYVGATAQNALAVTTTGLSATVAGLTNGTRYTFTVTATNAIGSGRESGPSNSVVPAPSPAGSWTAVHTEPIEPLATYAMYNGEFVAWDGWQQPQPSVIWDPTKASPTYTTLNAPDSVFCNGGATLPDGRLLVAGGYGGLSTGQIGIVDTTIFDPVTNSWSRVTDMHYPRWYPTLTELADGRYLALSGNSTDPETWADTPEVYDPTTNKWTLLTGVDTSSVHEVEYPFTYELPSGQVFVIGPEEDNSHLLDVNAKTWTSTGSSGLFNGSSVMYRPGKILYSGGAAYIDTPSTAQADTAVIDLTASTPTWRKTAPMNKSRIYHNLTMLADGTVLAVGGSTTSDQRVITTGQLPTEIWDPATEKWTPSAPISAARNYHSTSVLLPDGRVWVGGGGHSNGLQDPGQYSSQIYSPAYLSLGTRPTITAAPASTTYGAAMTVTTPDAAGITGVNLVSLGADTHQIDMNQHFVPLTYTAGSGSLTVQAPAAAATAPAGYYMMFILKNGVPSVAKIVHLGSSAVQTVPSAPTNVVAAAGDSAASLSWSAPADGGSPITGYTVTPYVAGVAKTPVQVTGTPPATSTTVSGLTNGTTYTFTVKATNAVGTGSPSTASSAVTPTSGTPPPTVPGAPTNVTATAGNASATVGWTAPANGGSAITSYKITPYIASTAQPATTVAGSATSATVTGLTNGTGYNFTVQAVNAVGPGAPSTLTSTVVPSAAVVPAFVQQVSTRVASKTSVAVTPTTAVKAGNRLIVEVGVWNSSHSTASGVTDSAGDTFTELTHFTAGDGTELSVWSAPITAGGGAKPTITVKVPKSADIGVGALEYSGLSTASAPLDVTATASGMTTSARSVSSGSTDPTTATNELAVGFYVDSGFGTALSGDPGYTARVNVSPFGDMDLFVEDTVVTTGATPAPSFGTGANTVWLAATLVFKAA